MLFITAPKIEIAKILTFLTKYISTISTESEITPAGNEYNIAEILPENKLPSITLITKVINPNCQPKIKVDNRIKILLSPIFADGKISGGNALSIIKAIVAKADKIPHNAIFLIVIFFIIYPATGGTSPSKLFGTIFKPCGAQ